MKQSSLISRFAASTALLAAAVVVLGLAAFFALYSDYFRGTLNAMLRGFSLSMAEVIWRDPDLAQKVAERHRLGLVIEDADGRYAFRPGGESIAPEEQMKVGGRFQRIDVTGPDGRKIIFYWDTVDFLRAYVPPLVGFCVLLLAMIGATYLFQLAHLRPLRQLRAGVDAVSRGDFSTQVPVVRHDDIGQVATAFNQMTRQIEEMIDAREHLLGDVSHELRSPLTRIKVALELLPAGRERDAIARDVRVMESLITALLEREQVRALSERADADTDVDLAAVTREIVNAFEVRAPGIEFDDANVSTAIRGDADLLQVLVHNLVDNAVKFSLPDSLPVEVSLGATNGTVDLVVQDDGRGIPEEDIERVFEPFVKLDPSRGHRSGYGLGLNICRRIVEAHQGTIEIAGGEERGTRVLVRLPGA